MSSPTKPLFPVHQNGRTGYIEATGQVSIPITLVAAGPFSEGLAAVHTSRQFPMRDSESKWGYIDSTGRIVIQPKFQLPKIITGSIDLHFSEGLAAGGNGRKCGYINREGEYTIDPIFDGCSAFSGGVAIVQQKSQYGCINMRGEFLVPLQPYLLFGFREGRAPILVDEKYGFIDEGGNMIVAPVYSGKSIHPCAYGFHEGLAAVESWAGVGFVDRAGAIVIPPRETGITELTQQLDGFLFSEGRAAFAYRNSWGYLDRDGSFAISPAYERAGAFSEGLAAVYSNGLWKYIDTQGFIRFIVPDQEPDRQSFFSANMMFCGRFENGLAPIHILEDRFGVPAALGYLNKDGKYVWAPSV
jgi:WG containing repeat